MEQKEALDTLNEIRNMMAKSTKVLSLNGASCIFAGTFALIAAYIANSILASNNMAENEKSMYLVTMALLLLALCVCIVFFMAKRKAKKLGMTFKLNQSAVQLLFHFLLPLALGGALTLACTLNGYYELTATMMLTFYGLAVVNGSAYTYSNAKYLGYASILLGLASGFTGTHPVLYWALGFGVCHIVYGTYFYLKHERK